MCAAQGCRLRTRADADAVAWAVQADSAGHQRLHGQCVWLAIRPQQAAEAAWAAGWHVQPHDLACLRGRCSRRLCSSCDQRADTVLPATRQARALA